MGRFTRQEAILVATSAGLIWSRVFGLSLVLPNFRGHYEASLAADPVWIGTAFSAYGLTLALMQVPMGMLGDRFGRRPVLVAGGLCFVAGSLWAAVAGSIGTLIAARLLQGFGAIGSTAMAAVGETVAAERRTVAMAFVGIPAGAGFLMGFAAGPLLYPAVGMAGLFILTGCVGAVAMAPLARLRLASPAARPAAGSRPVGLPVIALALAGFTSSFALTTTLWSLPSTDWRDLLPMVGVALVGVVLLARRVDRAGWTWQPIALAVAALAVAAPLVALGPKAWLLASGGLFFSAHALLSSAVPSQVSRLAGRRGGRAHGIQNVVAYSGTFVAGPIAGALVGRPAVPFVLLAAVAAAAVALLGASMARQARPATTPEVS